MNNILDDLRLATADHINGCQCRECRAISELETLREKAAMPASTKGELQAYGEFVQACWRGASSASDRNYTLIALAGEVGELLNAYKKRWLRRMTDPGYASQDRVPEELGDVLYYVVRAAQEAGLTFPDLVKLNAEKLLTRSMACDNSQVQQRVSKAFRDLVELVCARDGDKPMTQVACAAYIPAESKVHDPGT